MQRVRNGSQDALEMRSGYSSMLSERNSNGSLDRDHDQPSFKACQFVMAMPRLISKFQTHIEFVINDWIYLRPG
jgi:hypothetical protein